MITPTVKQPGKRLLSLDALRGFDMFWIISGEQIIHTLAKVTQWRGTFMVFGPVAPYGMEWHHLL